MRFGLLTSVRFSGNPLLRLLAILFLVAASSSSADAQTTYYWDSNGVTAGFGTTTGTWGTSTFWSTNSAGTSATSNPPPTNIDTVNFGTATLNYGNAAVGVASGGVSIGSIVIGSGQTTALTLGTTGNSITIANGITKNTGSAILTLASPIVLSAAQAWTNNSTNAITVSGTQTLNNGGFDLTIGGSGNTTFAGSGSNLMVISGAGGLTMNGTGFLTLGGNSVPVHTYSGTTTLNGGVTMISNNNLGTGNLTMNGGVIESYWATNFIRALGSGAGEVQITGGASGFSLNGSTAMSVILGNNASNEAVWGSANFNPSTFVLQSQYSQGTSALTFANRIDLNGADRTIQVNSGVAGTASATISNVIRNTTGTASLTKTGAGMLILSGANTYNGGTIINAGTLRFSGTSTMPSLGNVQVNTGASIGINLGGSGNWTTGTSGVGTLGGLLSGVGGAGSSTVSYSGNVGLLLNVLADSTYTGIIGNPTGATSLALTKLGSSQLTLSGANTYSGGTTLSAGTLNINHASAIGTGAFGIAGGTINNTSGSAITLSTNNLTNITSNFTFTGTNDLNLGTGNFTINGTRQITVSGSKLTFGGSQTTVVAGGINKLGSGTLAMLGSSSVNSGANTITAGVLEVGTITNGGVASSLGTQTNAAANLIFGSASSTLRYVGTSNTTTNRSFTMSSGVGGGATIESSGSGTLSLDNTIAIAYGTTNQTRLLTLGGTNTGDNVFSKLITNNGTGELSLTKSGVGTWVLGGNNTYTGLTDITAGTLRVNGTSNSTATVSIASLATLGGTGTLGSAAVSVFGTIAPGNSIGTLTVGSASFNNGSTLAIEIGNLNTNDQFAVSGLLSGVSSPSITVNLIGNVTDYALSTPVTYTVMSGGSSSGLSTSNFTLNTSGITTNVGGTWSHAFTGTQLNVTFSPVPEPATVGLFCTVAAGLCGLIRRRRSAPTDTAVDGPAA